MELVTVSPLITKKKVDQAFYTQPFIKNMNSGKLGVKPNHGPSLVLRQHPITDRHYSALQLFISQNPIADRLYSVLQFLNHGSSLLRFTILYSGSGSRDLRTLSYWNFPTNSFR